MNGPVINGHEKNEAYLVYLNTVSNMGNLLKAMFKARAYVDYLQMLNELLASYDPNMTCTEQVENIKSIVKKWTEGGIQ